MMRCDGEMSEDGGSGGPRVPCDAIRYDDGSVKGGCDEPCGFIMGKKGYGVVMDTNGFKHYNKMEHPMERPNQKVSLHGLGFLQIQLTDQLRIHIWHPDLPRRRCFKYSSAHNHRFGFESTVLTGMIVNRIVTPIPTQTIDKGDQYYLYRHDGPRMRHGNRAWIPATDEPWRFVHTSSTSYVAGQKYPMLPYVWHETGIPGDGRAATLMYKTEEHEDPAHSACQVGVKPDEAFDRFQMTDNDMWAIARDVLGS